MFYAKLESALDQCPHHDALIVLSNINAVYGIERAGIRNDNLFFIINLARSTNCRSVVLEAMLDLGNFANIKYFKITFLSSCFIKWRVVNWFIFRYSVIPHPKFISYV